MTKIAQWNIRSVRYKTLELRDLTLDHQIIILSETWQEDNNRIKISGYHSIQKNRQEARGGGVAILVKHGIPFSIIEEEDIKIDKIETCGITISLQGQRTDFIAAYRPPNTNLNQIEWTEAITRLKRRNRILVGGDFNAHHVRWGCSTTNSQGRLLLESLEQLDLVLLNDGSHTRVNRPDQESSAIDLTFTSSDMTLECDWKVTDDPRGSDHLPITIEISLTADTQRKFTTRIPHSNRDWKLFQNILEEETTIIREKSDHKSAVDLYDELLEGIKLALRKSKEDKKAAFPNTNESNYPNTRNYRASAPWWEPKCTEAIEERKKGLKKYKETSNYTNYINYKRIEANTKRTLRDIKEKDFKRFAGTLNRESDPKYIWGKIKAFKNRQTGKTYTTTSLDPNPNLDQTIGEMCPPYAQEDWNPLLDQIAGRGNPLELTIQELEKVINSTKSNSSPGMDGIDYQIIDNFPKNTKKLLVQIFNGFLEQETTPPAWSQALVYLIPKPGSNKTRPISITSCLSKIMEKWVKNRIEWWAENKGLIPPVQTGFRKNNSCLDNLALLTTDIHINFALNQYTATLFLDIKGAYDNVNIRRLEDLQEEQLHPKLTKFCYNMYGSRQNFFHDRGTLIGPLNTSRGLMQGSALSPILYNIYTRKVTDTVSQGTKILQYADDIAIYRTGKNIGEVLIHLEEDLANMGDWLSERGLSLAPEKSNLIIFTRHRTRENEFGITYRNQTIRNIFHTRFLGIIIDHKLSWNNQIK